MVLQFAITVPTTHAAFIQVKLVHFNRFRSLLNEFITIDSLFKNALTISAKKWKAILSAWIKIKQKRNILSTESNICFDWTFPNKW